MRRAKTVRLITVALSVAASVSRIPTAEAQTGSVKTIFEKYNLLGTFAPDCSKPVSRSNPYYINRPLGPGQVQRDEMHGPTDRSWFVILDRASEVGANRIALGGRITGVIGSQSVSNQAVEGVWQIEGNRVRTVELLRAGKKMVSNGRLMGDGREVWWTYRCGASGQ